MVKTRITFLPVSLPSRYTKKPDYETSELHPQVVAKCATHSRRWFLSCLVERNHERKCIHCLRCEGEPRFFAVKGRPIRKVHRLPDSDSRQPARLACFSGLPAFNEGAQSMCRRALSCFEYGCCEISKGTADVDSAYPTNLLERSTTCATVTEASL